MTKLLSDEHLAAATGRKLAGPGHRVVEDLRGDVARLHPESSIRIPASGAQQLVAEVDMLREVAFRLGVEVHAFRDNVQLERDAPPPRLQSCLNCISFDAVKSTEAHMKVERQAIVGEAGVCRHNPPTALPRGPTGGPPVASSFPPVWPDQWCRRWEHLTNRKVPTS